MAGGAAAERGVAVRGEAGRLDGGRGEAGRLDGGRGRGRETGRARVAGWARVAVKPGRRRPRIGAAHRPSLREPQAGGGARGIEDTVAACREMSFRGTRAVRTGSYSLPICTERICEDALHQAWAGPPGRMPESSGKTAL